MPRYFGCKKQDLQQKGFVVAYGVMSIIMLLDRQWSAPAQGKSQGRGIEPKQEASTLGCASHAMLSQNVLHGTEADAVPVSQLSLGCTSQKVRDERQHIVIGQPVSYPPHARDATADGNRVAIRIFSVSLTSP